ncbi:MAG TPA: DUF397 domain-containing protein [Jatrophihabitantaceae bacterium]|jgi:hypothetical protein
MSPIDRSALRWRKASGSASNGSCVEVASIEGGVAVRDSKDPDGPILQYSDAEWIVFVDGVRNGEFDLF